MLPPFIGLMTPAGATWSCHYEVIISSLQWVIKRSLNDNTCSATVYWMYGPCMKCAIKLAPSDIKSSQNNFILSKSYDMRGNTKYKRHINIDSSCFGPYLYSDSLSGHWDF